MKKVLLCLLLVLVTTGLVKWLTAPSPVEAAPVVTAPVPRGPGRAQARVMAFGASWCGACHRDKPKRDELARHIDLIYVDVDNDPSRAAQQFHITRLPTYILFEDSPEGYGPRLRTTNIDEVFRFLSL